MCGARGERSQTQTMQKVGYQVVEMGHFSNTVPGKISPPKMIIDKFYDSNKYGQYLHFVCQ